jgi:hypothetical protein
MGPLPRLIAHHVTGQTLLVDAVVLVVVLGVFGGIWLRERRRRVNRSRRMPEMRD